MRLMVIHRRLIVLQAEGTDAGAWREVEASRHDRQMSCRGRSIERDKMPGLDR